MSVWGPNKGLTQVKNDSFKSTVSCVLKCVGVCVSRSVVSDFATPWTVACQAPLFMEFSRQEYWSG